MFRSYLKIAFRTLMKNRLISFINIFGLGLSMSVGMMELVILQDQLSYDRFHPAPERTYRVTSGFSRNNGEQLKLASTPIPVYDLLKADTGIVEQIVSIYPALNGETDVEGRKSSINGAFTQPSFFKVFGFRLEQGNPQSALESANGIVLSKNAAARFFGRSDPMGRVLTIDKRGSFIVMGILADIPGKSHLDFDGYASTSAIPLIVKKNYLPDNAADWTDFRSAYTYVMVKKNQGILPMKGRINALAAQLNKDNQIGKVSFDLQPVEKITPNSDNLFNDIGHGTTWAKLWVGINIALIILLAACFNHTNLTVARALTRAKEVGIRKIVGAQRYQIFIQYIMEAMILAFLSWGFAWMLLSFIIRYAPFNDDYEMIPSSFQYNMPYILWTIAFALLTGLLAGIAPAWILSSFKPLRVLKNLSTAKIFGKISLQKSLIVFQYSLSLVIIIFLVGFYRQFSFMADEDPGFKVGQVLVVPLNGNDERIAANQLATVNGVESIAAFSHAFNFHFNGPSGKAWITDPKESVAMNYTFADRSFLSAMKMKLLAGRDFHESTDTAGEKEIILNAKASRLLGFQQVENAVGKKLFVNDSTTLEIIGVASDFKYENSGKPVAALGLRNKKGLYQYLYISVGGKEPEAVKARISQTWKTFSPSPPFSASWLEKDLEKANSQTATLSLLGYLAFMTLSIATLGLLGLVIYTVETKRKEIGIRKVVGASKKQVIKKLSGGFVKLLLIAGLIAVPIGYAMSFLFQLNFVHRAEYTFPVACLCFLLVLCIGLATIISQTYRASLENPVNSLRSE